MEGGKKSEVNLLVRSLYRESRRPFPLALFSSFLASRQTFRRPSFFPSLISPPTFSQFLHFDILYYMYPYAVVGCCVLATPPRESSFRLRISVKGALSLIVVETPPMHAPANSAKDTDDRRAPSMAGVNFQVACINFSKIGNQKGDAR